MKVLYLLNLFFVCCSSFIIQPSYQPIKFNPSNINYYKNDKFKLLLRKQSITIVNLQKNNNENNNENEIYKIKLIINFVYNIILYTYIISHFYK
jgi:hypothetical protein